MSRHGYSEVISCTFSKMNMMELIEEFDDEDVDDGVIEDDEVKRSMVSKRSVIEELHQSYS